MNAKQRLRNKCDKLWFLKYLKECCELCGSTFGLQGHHFYFKGSYGHLRYEKDNHITLCKGCHFVLHHQDAKKIEQQIQEVRGKRWFNRLTKKSRNRPTSSYLTMSYYKEQLVKLK